jgi:Ca-activated chloride channel family protein
MTATGFRPVQAATGKEIELAMQSLWLTGRILPVGARLLVRHIFQSKESKPLEVVYSFILPRDAALRRFRVSGEGFSVRSELKPVEEAVKAYEAGIEAGHLATLARQYGDGIVNLTLGNLRPGETVTVTLELLAGVEAHDDGIRFRFPFTLAPSYHRRARTMEVEPGTGEMELPEDEFGDVILPRFHRDAASLHQVGFDLGLAMPQEAAEIASPSHPVRILREGPGRSRVALAGEKDAPDRDLVLEVRLASSLAGVLSGMDRTGRARFAAVIPSDRLGETPQNARRVAVVLDRSGSMQGAPIEQARKAIGACLGALSEEDRFGLLAFDDRVEHFRAELVAGSMRHRDLARDFLSQVHARGGTELAQAIAAAAAMLGGDGDILVMTDGQVFATEQVLAQARATHVRIHCLGIGSASQDRFLALLARETGGVSRFLTPSERVDLPAVDLFASVGRPVASAVRVTTDGMPEAVIAPQPPEAVFAGSPLVIFGEAAGGADGRLLIEWSAGKLDVPVPASDSPIGETLRLVQGARMISDLEARITSHKREADRIDDRLQALSEALGLASRRMALVAVVERAGDRPGEVPKTVVVPVGMPQQTPFDAYFGAATTMACMPMPSVPPGKFRLLKAVQAASLIQRGFSSDAEAVAAPPPEPPVRDAEDVLLLLAARLEPDGGMPGTDEFERIIATLVALAFFMSEGHTAKRGAFRTHVAHMLKFLQSLKRPDVDAAVARIRPGELQSGAWRAEAETLGLGVKLDSAALWQKF